LVALGVGCIAISIAYGISRRANRTRASELFEATRTMHACFSRVYGGAEALSDALDLGFASAAPLAECREPTLRAQALATRMRRAWWVKDPGSAAILSDQLNDFAALPFAEDATALVEPARFEQLTTIDVWHRSVMLVACSVATAESAVERDCRAFERDFTLQEPRVVSEVTGAKPESLAIETARQSLLVLTLETGASTWLLESLDAGTTWKSRLVTPNERPKPPPIGRPLPAGTLVGRSSKPARAFVAGTADGAVEIASYAIPDDAKAPWGEPLRTRLAASSLPSFAPTADLVVGRGDEQWIPLLARDATTGHATLVMSGERKLFALGFDPPKAALLSLVTGACPPSVLAHTSSGLTLHVPVARSMAAFPVAPPVSFASSAEWRTASAACTESTYAVAYLTRERVVVQVTEPNGWTFSRARVVTQSDVNGTPVAVKLVGTKHRLLALVLRKSMVGDLLRAEVLASADAGATWE
jgi:hypothetical protein